MRYAMFLLLALSLLLIVACGEAKDKKWQSAEVAARSYFKLLNDQDFGAAYDLHSGDAQLAKESTRPQFIATFKGAAAKYPTIFNFTSELEAQTKASTRAGLYEFKANLKWPGGYPLGDLPEQQLPILAPEMRITMKEVGGSWRVFVVRRWYSLSEEMAKTTD